MRERGKFVVIYGVNNLGKSAQVELLAKTLTARSIDVAVVKYPIYSLEPTGPRINAALRESPPLMLTPEELQQEFAQNRRDYQPTLEGLLSSGKWVIAEDYKGTGIAWGVTYGVPLETMEEMNKGLLEEDLAILLHGERFTTGIEKIHLHEKSGKWEEARETHLGLAHRYGWEVVDANAPMTEVADDIWFRVIIKLL